MQDTTTSRYPNSSVCSLRRRVLDVPGRSPSLPLGGNEKSIELLTKAPDLCPSGHSEHPRSLNDCSPADSFNSDRTTTSRGASGNGRPMSIVPISVESLSSWFVLSRKSRFSQRGNYNLDAYSFHSLIFFHTNPTFLRPTHSHS